MVKWVLLKSFDSEAEARVVESFLRANDFEVELLDTRVVGSGAGRAGPTGMRLMVRSEDLERARNLITEARRSSHLEIVEGTPPAVERSPFEKWIVLLLLLVAAVF